MADVSSSNSDSNIRKGGKTIKPLTSSSDRDAAAALIRGKLDQLYAEEPKAEEEIIEEEQMERRTVHQEFMHRLVNSGRSLAEIQTAWHEYYIELPDEDKHQVWQEFYDSNKLVSKYHKETDTLVPFAPDDQEAGQVTVQDHSPKHLAVHPPKKLRDVRTTREVKQLLLHKVSAGGQLKAKHHLQSLIFGLGIGAVVVLILLFGLFNQFVIAPFIQPSRNASAAPLIINSNGVAPTSTPSVIIPKINVEIPVDYSQTSTNEEAIQQGLESGVVHYPTTSRPGENGNAAYFGHSSNNIFNKGKYKFAFVLLRQLVPGDTFYLTYEGKVFVYKVITKTVVDPSEVGVLNPVEGQTATATLITCDPPGTTLKRMVIVGQQISPAIGSNAESTATPTTHGDVDVEDPLPGNAPSLFSRIWNSVF